METTPIELLKHHLEMLTTQKEVAEQQINIPYSDFLVKQIWEFKEAIDILETVKNRGESTTKRIYQLP